MLNIATQALADLFEFLAHTHFLLAEVGNSFLLFRAQNKLLIRPLADLQLLELSLGFAQLVFQLDLAALLFAHGSGLQCHHSAKRPVVTTAGADRHEILRTGNQLYGIGEKAQVIIICMDMPESSILLKQWYDMKVPALPFGSIIAAAEQPGFWKATEGKGEFTLANVVNAGNAPSNATDWTMKFVNAYKKRWGLEPEGYGTSSSYMAVYVLKDAIEKAGTLDSDAVVAALEKTDMMGVYGRIRFDPKSHQVIPSLDPNEGAVGTIFQWQSGKRVVVFPKSIAMGEIELPPWMK